MDLTEILRNLREIHPYAPELIGGVVAATTASIIALSYSFGRRFDSNENPQEKSIKEAMKYDKEDDGQSTVKGVVECWNQSLRGYSGFIRDDSGRAPFYFDEEEIKTCEGEGLVPLIFDYSIKNNKTVRMNVTLSDSHSILYVERLVAEMDGREYEI